MTTASTTPLSAADTAWLHMERSHNPMCVVAKLVLDGPVDLADLQQRIEERMLTYDRFRSRVVEAPLKLGTPHWQVDPVFDARAHFHRVALPAPGDQKALQEMVGDLVSTRLDLEQPLWQVHLIEGVQLDDGRQGCAVVFRIHHCIADGIAQIRLLLSMVDEALGEASEPRRYGRKQSWLRKVAHEGLESARHPSHAALRAKQGLAGAASLGKLLLLPPDPPTRLKKQLTERKVVAWSPPLPLADVKAAGKQLGGTINDVLVATLTGALRRYLLTHGESAQETIRAVLPVNLRPLDGPVTLGNRFGLVFLGLPLHLDDPRERLEDLKARMDDIKGSPEALIAFGMLAAMGKATPYFEDKVLEIFSTKGTAVVTNVPGPRQPLHLLGRKVRDVMFWVPQSGDLGLGVSLLSYAGTVRIGVGADASVMPDPEVLVDAFVAELELLRGQS
jgi:diacylglycerol O-acyltransferase